MFFNIYFQGENPQNSLKTTELNSIRSQGHTVSYGLGFPSQTKGSSSHEFFSVYYRPLRIDFSCPRDVSSFDDSVL